MTLGTVIRETVGAVKTARAMGWDVDFLVSGAGYAQTVAALGGEAMNGLYGDRSDADSLCRHRVTRKSRRG